jgi:hypothetical protein
VPSDVTILKQLQKYGLFDVIKDERGKPSEICVYRRGCEEFGISVEDAKRVLENIYQNTTIKIM